MNYQVCTSSGRHLWRESHSGESLSIYENWTSHSDGFWVMLGELNPRLKRNRNRLYLVRDVEVDCGQALWMRGRFLTFVENRLKELPMWDKPKLDPLPNYLLEIEVLGNSYLVDNSRLRLGDFMEFKMTVEFLADLETVVTEGGAINVFLFPECDELEHKLINELRGFDEFVSYSEAESLLQATRQELAIAIVKLRKWKILEIGPLGIRLSHKGRNW